jgi:hypothetical protein
MSSKAWPLTVALFLTPTLPAPAQVIHGLLVMDNARTSC